MVPEDQHHRRIDEASPLYSCLSRHILPVFHLEVKSPVFILKPIHAQKGVYLFEEKKTGKLLVGKFFGDRLNIPETEKCRLLDTEFDNLSILRQKGLRYAPNQVVEPIGKAQKINCLLIENYVSGNDLDYYISKCIFEDQQDRLKNKLSALARFFAKLHDCTSISQPIDIGVISRYFSYLIENLFHQKLVEIEEAGKLISLCNEWLENGHMKSDISVLVHGDATPTNFIFHPEEGITAIDLERMHFSDNALDIGMLAAELKHHFAAKALNAQASEPFIHHFIEEYYTILENANPLTSALTERNPFYMALGEIRIARNEWLHLGHRRWLVEEAFRCLSQ